MRGDPQVTIERGRNLVNGISYKCSINQHKDCTAARCKCHCLHGRIPSLMDVLTKKQTKVCVDCGQSESFGSAQQCRRCYTARVEAARQERARQNQKHLALEEIHVELPSGAIARVDPAIKPETLTALDEMTKAVVDQTEREILQSCGIELERSKSSDETTFASLTAGLGRRGSRQPAASQTRTNSNRHL